MDMDYSHIVLSPRKISACLIYIIVLCQEQSLSFRTTTKTGSFYHNALSGRRSFQLSMANGVFNGGNIFDQIASRFSKKKEVEKTEEEMFIDYVGEKPWRASKVKNLPIHYRPWKESWHEKFRTADDGTIYLYTFPKGINYFPDRTAIRPWLFPWLWTKIKAERLSYVFKHFQESLETVTVQEHMEIDAFYEEFDMPYRWGILRSFEFDTLICFGLNLVYFTDFTGFKPTDLGLRPDGSVRTCAVQFQNCISSSNNPDDINHYAKPLKWDRSKSPEQAYDEVKAVFQNYPKRGLKWSSGWIDRGGWTATEFGDKYFYGQGKSMTWGFIDDVELVVDVEKREVQYRSASRIGQHDFDVQRKRYNQFVRMLEKKGSWENEQIAPQWYIPQTPVRWTQLLLDKTADKIDTISTLLIENINIDKNIKNNQFYTDLENILETSNKFITSNVNEIKNILEKDERVIATEEFVQKISDEFINYIKENNIDIPLNKQDFDVIIDSYSYSNSNINAQVTMESDLTSTTSTSTTKTPLASSSLSTGESSTNIPGAVPSSAADNDIEWVMDGIDNSESTNGIKRNNIRYSENDKRFLKLKMDDMRKAYFQ
eukprot:gene7047-14341_t